MLRPVRYQTRVIVAPSGAMKNPTTDNVLCTSRLVARFGGRFLCRSPPAVAARRRLIV